MVCALTGATGYVGSQIALYFESQGWKVLRLNRRAGWDLTTDPAHIPWHGVQALVHCAYDFRCVGWKEINRMNVEGSIRLLKSARDHGVSRVVFISSVSAFEGCRSLYGKAKLLIEQAALEMGCAVVRPGLVYGKKPGGMMGSLEKAGSAGRLLPMIGAGSSPQYLVHDEDLARLAFLLCQPETVSPAAPITAANPEKVPLREIIRRIAARKDRRVHFIPVPWRLIYAGLRTLEILRLPTPFRSDSLVGMIFQNRAPDFTLPPGLDVSFRRFE